MTTYVEITLGCCRTFRLEGAKLTVEKKTNRQVVSDAFDLAIVASGSTRVKLMNMPALNRSVIYLGVVLIHCGFNTPELVADRERSRTAPAWM